MVIHRFGEKEVLTYDEDVEKPVPKANEVLVRVMAAGINPVDWKLRKGNLTFIT
ncbi:MAG: NAD(P)-dependent alcohol dehydrogenase, partial [Verrucomicrobia bacterium]|nr:NAD(P)-dependent alcohol dehydrogenase [Cytophagales bacterium]